MHAKDGVKHGEGKRTPHKTDTQRTGEMNVSCQQKKKAEIFWELPVQSLWSSDGDVVQLVRSG